MIRWSWSSFCLECVRSIEREERQLFLRLRGAHPAIFSRTYHHWLLIFRKRKLFSFSASLMTKGEGRNSNLIQIKILLLFLFTWDPSLTTGQGVFRFDGAHSGGGGFHCCPGDLLPRGLGRPGSRWAATESNRRARTRVDLDALFDMVKAATGAPDPPHS